MDRKNYFITGSTDGIGFLAAQSILEMGHYVVLHARNISRAREATEKLNYKFENQYSFIVGDLSNIDDCKSIVNQINDLGKLNGIIHNAGTGESPTPNRTKLGLSEIFHVNVFAPYFLSKYIISPTNLIFISSGLHQNALFHLEDAQFESRPWSGLTAYNESKLFLTMVMRYFSEFYRDSIVTAVRPGWVPTKMGGVQASDDLEKGVQTQVNLAAINRDERLSGEFFFHNQKEKMNPLVYDKNHISELIQYLDELCRKSLIL